MKLWARVLSFSMALTVPAALTAQSGSQRPLSLGISGGMALATGEFGSGMAGMGYDVTGHLYYKLPSSNKLALRGDVSFDKWGDDSDNRLGVRNLGFTGNAIFALSNSGGVRPYLLGGVGLYNSKTTYKHGYFINDSYSDTDFGFQLGGGLQFQLSGFSTFAELRYVTVYSDVYHLNWLPVVFGVKF